MTEYASSRRGDGIANLTASLRRAHPSIVRSVNARRRVLGLVEVQTNGDPLAPLPKPAPILPAARGGRPCKTANAARWAGLKLDAAVACGRLKMSRRR